jgi:hypothetical protein
VTTPAIVWLVIGLVTTAAALAVLIALFRHLFVLGRALSRFQQEVGPVAAEIGAETERASSRSGRRSGGRAEPDRR